jgi:pyridoxamine 5'-phosphate oxidase family protein
MGPWEHRKERHVIFTDKEIEYLAGQRLGRLATVTSAGRAHVVPTGFQLNAERTAIDIGGRDLEGRRPLYLRNIESNLWVAFVVDDLASVDPWTPRGVTIRGRAEVHTEEGQQLGQGFGSTWIRITPTHITSWGIDADALGPPNSRKVG